jgi:fluoride exporter
MHKLVLIGLGGLLGTLCRYALAAWIDERSHSPFPFGTLAVNLAGCFAAGLLFPIFERAAFSPELRLAVFSGFLGGFTTFSAYGLQTVALANGGMFSMAALNVGLSNAAGLALVWLGSSLSRSVM